MTHAHRLVGVLFFALACSRPASDHATPRAAPSTSEQVMHGDNFTVRTRVTYHPNGTVDSVAASLPPGSVDEISIDTTGSATTLVLVEIEVEPRVRGGPSRFVTTFHGSDGRTIARPWEGAPGNESGTFRAILSVPSGAQLFGTVTHD